MKVEQAHQTRVLLDRRAHEDYGEDNTRQREEAAFALERPAPWICTQRCETLTLSLHLGRTWISALFVRTLCVDGRLLKGEAVLEQNQPPR